MHQPIYKRRWVRWTGLVVLVFLIGYGAYRAIRPDPKLKKVRQLQSEMAAAKDMTPEQRREKGQEMRNAMQQLSPDQRQQLAAEGRKRFEGELKRYSQMSAAEKSRYLDERIDQMEKMRQQFAQRNPSASGQGPAGGPGQGPRGGGNLSAEERDKRRRERLNETTPEFRAMMDNFRRDMANRRQQRGFRT